MDLSKLDKKSMGTIIEVEQNLDDESMTEEEKIGTKVDEVIENAN